MCCILLTLSFSHVAKDIDSHCQNGLTKTLEGTHTRGLILEQKLDLSSTVSLSQRLQQSMLIILTS